MKKLFFTFALTFLAVFVLAQTPYEKTMTEKIAKVTASQNADELTALANDFLRIGDKEKTQWLPYYYAAFATIQKGRALMMGSDKSQLDSIADQAQTYIDKAKAISGDNAEFYILEKMVHGIKMMVDPMSRFMTEGSLGAEALAKAEQLRFVSTAKGSFRTIRKHFSRVSRQNTVFLLSPKNLF